MASTDSTIAPPPEKRAIFFDERFVAARYEEINMLLEVFLHVRSCSRRTIDRRRRGRCQKAPYSRIYGRGLVSKLTGDFDKEKFGGVMELFAHSHYESMFS